MKIVEVDGVKQYRFEASEENARIAFEEAIGNTDISVLMTALLAAMSARKSKEAEAWRGVDAAIKEIDPDYNAPCCSYNWYTGAFVPQKAAAQKED